MSPEGEQGAGLFGPPGLIPRRAPIADKAVTRWRRRAITKPTQPRLDALTSVEARVSQGADLKIEIGRGRRRDDRRRAWSERDHYAEGKITQSKQKQTKDRTKGADTGRVAWRLQRPRLVGIVKTAKPSGVISGGETRLFFGFLIFFFFPWLAAHCPIIFAAFD